METAAEIKLSGMSGSTARRQAASSLLRGTDSPQARRSCLQDLEFPKCSISCPGASHIMSPHLGVSAVHPAQLLLFLPHQRRPPSSVNVPSPSGQAGTRGCSWLASSAAEPLECKNQAMLPRVPPSHTGHASLCWTQELK